MSTNIEKRTAIALAEATAEAASGSTLPTSKSAESGKTLAKEVEENRKCHSDAHPPEYRNRVESRAEVHQLLENTTWQYEERRLSFRMYESYDLHELRKLHLEWFPLDYSERFYKMIDHRRVTTLLAIYELPGRQFPVIIGAIIFNRTSDDFTSQNLKYTYMFGNYKSAYIMTLGVIDEFRRFKIGSKLVNAAQEWLEENDELCKIMYLHVIDYNSSAINFYRRLKFMEGVLIRDHYEVHGKPYDALIFFKYINGGEPPIITKKNFKWLLSASLRKITDLWPFTRNEQPEHSQEDGDIAV